LYNHGCSGGPIHITWSECVCVDRYSACNEHAPYCHLLPDQLYHIFSHYLINGEIFFFLGGGFLNIKCLFWLCLYILPEKFLILKTTEQDMMKNVYWSSCKVPIILANIYWNLNFPGQILKKFSNIKFHENPSSGSRVVPCGQTNGQTWWS